jgi:hypothetical protein
MADLVTAETAHEDAVTRKTHDVNNRIEHITADDIINAIDAAADSIGYERLGLKKGDLGTYSIRSSAAIAIYLSEVPIYTSMMLGRWSSNAFLRYIRKQVEQLE